MIGAAAALAVLAAVWMATGVAEYRRRWSGRQDHRATESPHWLLARSAWRAVVDGLVRPDGQVLPDDLRDFAPSLEGAPSREPSAPPNVVLIVLESVGRRWTSLGGRYETTPALAALARQGASFSSVYAHVGRSSDALAAMLLSRYPKLDFRDITDEYPRLAGTSLAALFHDRGYRTEYATSSDFGWANWRQFLEGRGFDRLVDYHELACTDPLSEWGVEDRCLVDEAVRFVDESRDRRFFFMGWTTQTHYPYEPTPGLPLAPLTHEPGPDAWDLNRYLNVLAESDRQMGRLFEALDRLRLTDRTLVVVLGDHGQSFGYPHESYGQGRTAFEEDVHIPLVIRGPGVRPATRPDTIGAQVDVAPTIAALAGLPERTGWQGRNLFGDQRSRRAYVFVAEDHFTLGVREDQWKYLWDLREGTEQLFDLSVDRDEQRNVAAVQAVRAAEMRRRLAAWMEANRLTYRQSG